LKNISFDSKLKGVGIWFYRKTSIHGENKPKIRISSSGGPYSVSVRRFDVIHKFLVVLKNIEFRLKTHRGLAFGFAGKKCLFTTKTKQRIRISSL
jgi:hypothetical protein